MLRLSEGHSAAVGRLLLDQPSSQRNRCQPRLAGARPGPARRAGRRDRHRLAVAVQDLGRDHPMPEADHAEQLPLRGVVAAAFAWCCSEAGATTGLGRGELGRCRLRGCRWTRILVAAAATSAEQPADGLVGFDAQGGQLHAQQVLAGVQGGVLPVLAGGPAHHAVYDVAGGEQLQAQLANAPV